MLTINCYPYGPLGENTYLITDETTGFKAIVDPGYFGVDIRMDIQNNAYLKYILLTHGHYDHYAAAEQYLEEYTNAIFVAPKGEEYLLHKSSMNSMLAGSNHSGKCPMPHKYVAEGDTLILGETEIRVIETPGHSEGGICFVTDNEVFSGDTLFRLSVGNSSFETGDWNTLVKSIKTKLYTLDDKMVVYPGHGDSTTIGYEKRANPFV